MVDGKRADFFPGPGDFSGEIEFGRGDPGSDEGAVVDTLGGFVGGKRKQPFFVFDAKIAIPAVGEFEGKGGLFLVNDILIDKQIGGYPRSG